MYSSKLIETTLQKAQNQFHREAKRIEDELLGKGKKKKSDNTKKSNTELQNMLDGQVIFDSKKAISLINENNILLTDKNGKTVLHHMVMNKCNINDIYEVLSKVPKLLLLRDNDDKTAFHDLNDQQESFVVAILDVYKQLAKHYLEHKNELGIFFLKDAIELCPASKRHSYLFEELIADFRRWPLDEAIEYFSAALKLENISITDKIRIQKKLADLYFEGNNFASAKEQFGKVIELNTEDANVYVKLGKIEIISGDFDAALNYCNKSLQYKGHIFDTLNCHLIHGQCVYENGNIPVAFADYKKILETRFDASQLDNKELSEFMSIRKYTLDNLFKLLMSNNDLSKIEKDWIWDLFREFDEDTELKLLESCQDPSTALGHRMLVSENCMLNVVQSILPSTPSLFHTSPTSGTLKKIHERIMEIKLDQAKRLNEQFEKKYNSDSNNDSNKEECWLQESDSHFESIPLNNRKK